MPDHTNEEIHNIAEIALRLHVEAAYGMTYLNMAQSITQEMEQHKSEPRKFHELDVIRRALQEAGIMRTTKLFERNRDICGAEGDKDICGINELREFCKANSEPCLPDWDFKEKELTKQDEPIKQKIEKLRRLRNKLTAHLDKKVVLEQREKEFSVEYKDVFDLLNYALSFTQYVYIEFEKKIDASIYMDSWLV